MNKKLTMNIFENHKYITYLVPHSDTRIFCYDIQNYTLDSNTTEYFYNILSKHDKEKYNSLLSSEKRKKFIIQRKILYEILETNILDRPFQLNITIDNGKPILTNSKASFSISHEGNLFCVALSLNEKKIGVDIENIKKVRSPSKYIPLLFRNYSYPFTSKEILRAWTIFEAFSKCSGITLPSLFRSDFSNIIISFLNKDYFFWNNYLFFTNIVENNDTTILTLCEEHHS
ncbi:MAG: hypothetical protein N2Z76_05505 [Treponemataceae bacterium]|nr:hypothetical protein [Treponemataceae bacterium]